MRILISWIAYHNDFTDGKTNSDGPTYNFYKYHFQGYDKHLLLATTDSETRQGILINTLLTDFPQACIEPILLSINDLGNLHEVKSKVEEILLQYKKHSIDIFFSPGASMMQLSWYICHTSLKLKTRLLQLRRKEHSTQSPDVPDLLSIEVERSREALSMILQSQQVNQQIEDKNFCMYSAIEPVYARARLVAASDQVPVLIYGDSGTGKEHLAHYIHKHSARKNKPFRAINCSALSDSLLESRLFGYRKDSFTGANSDREGIIEQADGDTLFLDEIGDISPFMQQSLLRVLQENEIEIIGDKKPKAINVRFIAASNKNLEKLCESGRFRTDLFYRLSVIELRLPSLQECGIRDISKLISFFIDQKHVYFGKPKLKINDEAMELIKSYPFGGNIRELEHLISMLYVFSTNGKVEPGLLPSKILESRKQSSLLWQNVEKDHIRNVLIQFAGNLKQTARACGYNLNTLKSKMKKYELVKESFKNELN